MTKRTIGVLLSILLTVLTLYPRVIYEVNPKEKGIKSLKGAKEDIEINRKGFFDDVVVVLDSGTYYLDEPLRFDCNSGGDGIHTVTYIAKEGTRPIISGGERVNSWKTDVMNKAVVNATLEHDIRNLWINGSRMKRAKGFTGYATSIYRDTIGEEKISGLLFPKDGFPHFKDISGLEMDYVRNWRNHHFKVQAIYDYSHYPNVPEDQILVIIKDFDMVLNQTPTVGIGDKHPYYFENALELLDEPGEWCYLPSSHTLYYYLKDHESPLSLDAMVAKHQDLLSIKSTSGNIVKNLCFSGLTFSHNDWLRPYTKSYISGQASVYRLPLNKRGMIPSAITIQDGRHIRFDSCMVTKIGTSGVQILNHIDAVEVQNCQFNDISGAAISISDFNHRKYTDSILPVKNVLIDNNLVTDIGIDYGSCPAIETYYAEDLTISHNELYDTPYTGISVGWGWSVRPNTQKNIKVLNNKIIGDLNKCFDGGAIYSLSNFGEDGLLIEGNYIEENIENRLAKTEGALYTDEGSSNVRIKNNVVVSNRNWFFYNKPGKVEVDTIFVLQDKRDSFGGNSLLSGETDVKLANNGDNIFDLSHPKAERIIENAGLKKPIK